VVMSGLLFDTNRRSALGELFALLPVLGRSS
jgi:hypothetical protein